MAENDNQAADNADAAAGAAAPTAPAAAMMAQYVKDLSFENPNAAQTLQRMAQGGNDLRPTMTVNVNVGARRLGEEAFEVELKVSATSQLGDDTAFAVELVYAGIFGARNLPDNILEPFLLVQAPHLLFPFARRIVADTVRDGGFAPLMLDPIDFAALYQQQRGQQPAAAAPENSGATTLGAIDLGEPQGNA